MGNFLIKTYRLTIRNLHSSDLEAFYFYRSDPEVAKYQNFSVMTKDEADDFIKYNSSKSFGKAGEWLQYAIENNQSGQLVGDCAIKLDSGDLKIAEIGITISPKHQQNGYAKETLLAILRWLFESVDIQSVVEIVDAENIASIKLAMSAGFRQEGEIKTVFFKGKYGSEIQFEMSKSDWQQKSVKYH